MGPKGYNRAPGLAGSPGDDIAVLDSGFANWPESRERMAAWYATSLGRELDASIRSRARELLRDVHGQHALQIGGTVRGAHLLEYANVGRRMLLLGEETDTLKAEPELLPFASDSINLLVLCHMMEYRESPRALLAEAERVLAPEGRMLIVGFNAWSLFGLRRGLPHDGVPWNGRFRGAWRLRHWCSKTGLSLEARTGCWRRPPAHGCRMRRWLAWMERGNRFFDRYGAVQLLLLRKRVIPVNPIPLGSYWRRHVPAGKPVRPTTCSQARATRAIRRAQRQQPATIRRENA